MTDPRLRVPLSALPGFDASGLALVRVSDSRVETCVYDEGSEPLEEGFRGKVLMIGVDRPEARWYERDGYALDFSDASTRDRAARWLGELLHLDKHCTAPGWRLQTNPFDPRSYGWLLTTYGKSMFFAHWASNSRQAGHPSIVPELGPMEFDYSLLPDGSSLADALALAIVCRHVGGQP